DAQVVVRSTTSDKEMTFDIGDPSGGGGISFSDDGKWVAFATFPKRAEAQRLRRQRRPIQNGVTIVNLETGEKREVEKIRQFAFSGEASNWIALARYGAQQSGAG